MLLILWRQNWLIGLLLKVFQASLRVEEGAEGLLQWPRGKVSLDVRSSGSPRGKKWKRKKSQPTLSNANEFGRTDFFFFMEFTVLKLAGSKSDADFFPATDINLIHANYFAKPPSISMFSRWELPSYAPAHHWAISVLRTLVREGLYKSLRQVWLRVCNRDQWGKK